MNRHWSKVFQSAINQKSVFEEKKFEKSSKINLEIQFSKLFHSAIKTRPKKTCSFIIQQKSQDSNFSLRLLEKITQLKRLGKSKAIIQLGKN